MLAFGNALPGALFGGKPKTKKYPEITQEEYEKEAIHQQELLMRTPRMRARNIAFDILTKNAEFCSSVVHVIGIAFNPRTTWISEVRPGSPAGKAGLKIGDVLLSVNGDKARPRNIARLIRKRFTNTDAEDIHLWIEGKKSIVPVTPILSCAHAFTIYGSDDLNAYTDGFEIVITTGMIEFAKDNNELALVIGHELAHGTADHLLKGLTTTVGYAAAGAGIDLAIEGLTGLRTDLFTEGMARKGQRTFSQPFEAEADYLGIYFAARAGYDMSKVADFWRRLGIEHPEAIHANEISSHPSTAERFIRIEKAHEEIEEKQIKALPLIPEILEPPPKEKEDE